MRGDTKRGGHLLATKGRSAKGGCLCSERRLCPRVGGLATKVERRAQIGPAVAESCRGVERRGIGRAAPEL